MIIQKKKGDVFQVTNLLEKPDCADAFSQLAVLGSYIISPDIFAVLKEVEPGRDGEIQLTDALSAPLDKRKNLAYRFAGKRFNTGNEMCYLWATVELVLKRKDLRQ